MTAAQPASAVPEIDVAGALDLIAAGALLLDVREQNEWDAGHAPMARHRPLAGVSAQIFVPGVRVVVVCRSGRRSASAVAQLRSLGIDALNLTGGMQAWNAAGASLVAASSAVPSIV